MTDSEAYKRFSRMFYLTIDEGLSLDGARKLLQREEVVVWVDQRLKEKASGKK